MATLLISKIAWDCDGYNPVEDCNLPMTILVVEAHSLLEDDDDPIDILSNQLTEVYGFCHGGFAVKKISPDVVGQRNKLDQKIDAIMEYPVTIHLTGS